MLYQQGESRVEVAKLLIYGRKMKEVSAFINAAHLNLNMKIIRELETTKMTCIRATRA